MAKGVQDFLISQPVKFVTEALRGVGGLGLLSEAISGFVYSWDNIGWQGYHHSARRGSQAGVCGSCVAFLDQYYLSYP
jgi:hypothetical protein